VLPPTPLILAEARTQIYGRCIHFKGCFEAFDTRDDAFRRERQMTVWRRAWKIELIEKTNPGWRDLYPEIC